MALSLLDVMWTGVPEALEKSEFTVSVTSLTMRSLRQTTSNSYGSVC